VDSRTETVGEDKMRLGVVIVGMVMYVSCLAGCGVVCVPDGAGMGTAEPRAQMPELQSNQARTTNSEMPKLHTVRHAASRVEKISSYTMTATAYCDRGITKSGVESGPGRIAVDPTIIPLGTRMWVEGYGDAVACDTGKFIKGHRIDVWIEDRQKCLEYGRKQVRVYVYE
jgi:3D (Asp-Asp-Asp) domain-containing protein